MKVNIVFERFHERKKCLVERREKEEADVQVSVDTKCAKILIKVTTLTTRDTYSFREVSHIQLNEDLESLTVICRDKHCALTMLRPQSCESSIVSHLQNLSISIKRSCDEMTSLLKAKEDHEKIVSENTSNDMRSVTYQKASPSAHITKDRAEAYYSKHRDSSGLTPLKKKVRDTTTPQKSKDFTDNMLSQELKFTEEQTRVIESALNGENLFVTGGAGTGKSMLLEKMIKELRSQTPDGVFVTATSGMSACAISGTTVHQFAGISSPIDEGECSREAMLRVANDIKLKKHVVQRWKDCDVLIIDEVSMLGRKVFETLDVVAREVRERSNEVFGGVQVILVGDFYQLPPVVRNDQSTGKSKTAGGYFCFDSPLWQKLATKNHLLVTVFRQRQRSFVRVLEEVRQGQWTTEAEMLLRDCVGRKIGNAVHLFTHRNEVNRLNEAELEKLSGKVHTFRATDRVKSGNKGYLRMLQNSTTAPENLVLKRDAQIILLKTLDVSKGLVNGARGEVRGFSGQGFPIITCASGERRTLAPMKFKIFMGNVEVASRAQVPCCLGWALSVHKSQGMSIDVASLHLKNVFEFGQVYVALSRARSLNNLQLDCHLDKQRVRAHPRVAEFYKKSCKFES